MTHSSPAVPTPALRHLPRTLCRIAVALSPTPPTTIVTVADAQGPAVETRMRLTRTFCVPACSVALGARVIARRSLAVGLRQACAEAVRVRLSATAATVAAATPLRCGRARIAVEPIRPGDGEA